MIDAELHHRGGGRSVAQARFDKADEGLHRQARLVAALARPDRFGPGCREVSVVETHISYVLLTGPFAYKIKKAVNLGFLDFTTLPSRRFYCEQELRLNRRTAAAVYLDVVPITGTVPDPRVGGTDPALEWAVRMRQFPQDSLLCCLLDRGELTPLHIDALASKTADFHSRAERAAADGPAGSPDGVLELALANLQETRALLRDAAELDAVDALAQWTRREHAAQKAVWDARRQGGFVRECHGDLHLGNIAWVDGQIMPFDCIEFSESLRWIDVMSEIAFTAMDLRYRGRVDFAHRFVNAYLECTGDYEGLAVLPFYLVYRAIVRAKVAALRRRQAASVTAAEALAAECRDHLGLASRYAHERRPAVVITHGLSGSGKTTLSQALLERIGAVRLRSDVERKRLQHLPANARTGSAVAEGSYTPTMTVATYDRLLTCARLAAGAGFVVLVDGAFLQRWQRERFRTLALALGVPFVVISFVAPEPVLRERILARASVRDASEADEAVLRHQLQTQEPLAPEEQPFVVTYDTTQPVERARMSGSWEAVTKRLRLRGIGLETTGVAEETIVER